MTLRCVVAAAALLLAQGSAHAINARYAQQLERSGCTQVSEAQGCDIRKTKAENAKAGFDTGVYDRQPGAATSPYAGQWVARTVDGATVASIRINAKDQVWVNGRRVKAKKSDGALVFRDGMVMYTIQGDRRLKGDDTWADVGAGTKGPISAE